MLAPQKLFWDIIAHELNKFIKCCAVFLDCVPVDIDPETKKILLRSRQATRQPSPDPSPVSSRRGSLTDEEAADQKAADLKSQGFEAFLDREVHLQEDVDPEQYLKFSSEVWR